MSAKRKIETQKTDLPEKKRKVQNGKEEEGENVEQNPIDMSVDGPELKRAWDEVSDATSHIVMLSAGESFADTDILDHHFERLSTAIGKLLCTPKAKDVIPVLKQISFIIDPTRFEPFLFSLAFEMREVDPGTLQSLCREFEAEVPTLRDLLQQIGAESGGGSSSHGSGKKEENGFPDSLSSFLGGEEGEFSPPSPKEIELFLAICCEVTKEGPKYLTLSPNPDNLTVDLHISLLGLEISPHSLSAYGINGLQPSNPTPSTLHISLSLSPVLRSFDTFPRPIKSPLIFVALNFSLTYAGYLIFPLPSPSLPKPATTELQISSSSLLISSFITFEFLPLTVQFVGNLTSLEANVFHLFLFVWCRVNKRNVNLFMKILSLVWLLPSFATARSWLDFM